MLYCGACCLLRDNVQVPVFIKGANWVPADAFESRVSSAKLTRLLKSLQDANMNAVRNWGGGIYQRVREKFLVCIVQYDCACACVCVCVCGMCGTGHMWRRAMALFSLLLLTLVPCHRSCTVNRTSSTTFVTVSGCWCGKSSCLLVPPTPLTSCSCKALLRRFAQPLSAPPPPFLFISFTSACKPHVLTGCWCVVVTDPRQRAALDEPSQCVPVEHEQRE